MKPLKFTNDLAEKILVGEKDSTWRLFDDKNLTVGDELSLVNRDTGQEFAKAIIISIKEKKMGEIKGSDFSGHEKYKSEEEMYEDFKKYYGDKVTPESVVKIIRFVLQFK
ncbi:MAG: ASCH domain-containing protein [Patescibacteria group bacterium]